LGWVGLGWIGLDWIGLNWIGYQEESESIQGEIKVEGVGGRRTRSTERWRKNYGGKSERS
jgi:hypothetical protein